MRKLLIISLLFAIILATPELASNSEVRITGGVSEKVVQPGDSINLIFSLETVGSLSISGVYYEITADAAVSGYSTGKVNIGGVSSGEMRTTKLPLIVSSSATNGDKTITVKIWYAGGKESPAQQSFTFQVGSDVSMHLSDIQYDSQHIEPGKEITLRALVSNVGDNIARDLFGSISADTEYIKPILSGGEYFVNELPVGESKEFVFKVKIDSAAETETYDATITLNYKDIFGNSNTETFTIGIPVSGTPNLEVLNTEIDGTDYKVDMENLGTSRAKAISVALVQNDKVMSVKVDNELKPDKQSTLRFKTYKAGTGQLKVHYIDDAGNVYDKVVDVEVPGSSGSVSKFAMLFFLVAVFEGYLIYRLKKGKPVKIPFFGRKH